MNIDHFIHIIRAAKEITRCNYFMVFGSQGIIPELMRLGREDEFWYSRELDLAPLPPDQKISDLIEGSLGEMSMFDETFGYYAHGCDESTPVLPKEWERRAMTTDIDGCLIISPSMEDLAISKYIANREKDKIYTKKMCQEGLIDKDRILALLEEIPIDREECRYISFQELEERIKSDYASQFKQEGPH